MFGFYQASERLHEKMTNFVSKNKAAQLQQRLVVVNTRMTFPFLGTNNIIVLYWTFSSIRFQMFSDTLCLLFIN